MFNKSFILLFIILFINLVLGVSVFLKNPKGRSSKYFFGFMLVSSAWMIASFLEDEIRNATILNLLLRTDYSLGGFIALFFLGLCLSITKSKLLDKKIILFLLFAIPLILSSLIFFSNFIIEGYSLLSNGLDPVLGKYEALYEVCVILFPLLGLLNLAIRYKKSTDEDKLNITYLFLGLLLFFVTIILTNVILVDIIKNSPNFILYSRLGIYSLAFVVFFSGYAIIKHRLFNIKVIVTEILSFAILIVTFFQIFTANNSSELLTRIILFVILFILVAALVRSVDNEVKQKEEIQKLYKEEEKRKIEIQKMADDLSVANDKLHQLDKAKSEFISIASHQLRTPPTAVKGFGSLLLEGTYGELNPAQKGAIEKIYISNERQLSLVEDLLNISRIEAGRMEFDFQETQIEDLVNEAVMTLELSAKAKNLYLNWQKPETPLPKIKADGSKIKEVISNMVDNSIKYTQKGGVSVKVENDEKSIRVIVFDTGIGMDEEEIHMIFEKFQRGKQVAHYHTDGTGLGMYIGKKIVAEHKGRIWAESEGKGRGSRFILELPLPGNETPNDSNQINEQKNDESK
jgi:signal transduction histidine kinase